MSESTGATENHHPPGTHIPTPLNPEAPSNDETVDPDQEAAQELESELSKLKVSYDLISKTFIDKLIISILKLILRTNYKRSGS